MRSPGARLELPAMVLRTETWLFLNLLLALLAAVLHWLEARASLPLRNMLKSPDSDFADSGETI